MLVLHLAGLASMWWAGRIRGRRDSLDAALDGWDAADALLGGIAAVWDSEDLESAQIAALKAATRSMHRTMTAEQILELTGAPVALVDKLLLDDKDLANE